VPEVIFAALVVSVVAEGAKDTPPVFRQAVMPVPLVVQSPLRLPLVIALPPEKNARFPEAGVPVVVTVPEPEAVTQLGVVPLVPSTLPACPDWVGRIFVRAEMVLATSLRLLDGWRNAVTG
jgi:hypothetical protein